MKILKEIDNYFDTHTKKDLVYSIAGSAVLIGFIFFYFINPSAERFEQSKEKAYKNLVNTFNQTQVELNVYRAQKIRLNNTCKIAKTKLVNLKKQKSFYEELTNLLDFTRFNHQKWANYVKNLIFDAKNEGMKVKLIENKIFDGDKNNTKLKNLPKNLIVKEMSIGIQLNGNYRNFIHYLYKYESLKDLLRVGSIQIKSKNVYYVKFNLYGYDK